MKLLCFLCGHPGCECNVSLPLFADEMISVRSDRDHSQMIISQAPTEPGPPDYLAIQMKIVDCMPPPILSCVGIENGHDRTDSCKVCGSGRFLCDPLQVTCVSSSPREELIHVL